MIKFFRRIRQSLLREDKFSKYILYATGEIVLVVIGILIAVQINNWNENRKKLKLKASYERSLINDLALDTLMLGELISENYQTLESLEKHQRQILDSETPIDTLVTILRNEFEPDLNTRFRYNRNTFNTLIATGNIDLFSKELNEMLMTLISLQDIEREKTNYFSQLYSTKLSRFTDDYPVSRRQNSKIINSIWADLDEKKLASSFISLTDIKGFTHYTFITAIENVKEQTTIVLNQLKTKD